MTPSASPRVTAYAGLAALFLFAALATRQPELAIVAAPFALLPALGLVLARAPEPRVWLTLERPTALEQDELELKLIVASERPIERLELLLGLPEGLEIVSGGRALSLRLGWEDERTIELRLRCARWGNYQLGDLRLRARDRLGLLTWETRLDRRTGLRSTRFPRRCAESSHPSRRSRSRATRFAAEGRRARVRRPARVRSRRPRPLDQLAGERPTRRARRQRAPSRAERGCDPVPRHVRRRTRAAGARPSTWPYARLRRSPPATSSAVTASGLSRSEASSAG